MTCSYRQRIGKKSRNVGWVESQNLTMPVLEARSIAIEEHLYTLSELWIVVYSIALLASGACHERESGKIRKL